MAGNDTKLSDGAALDPKAVIPCPVTNFVQRRVACCGKCEHFKGLKELNPKAEVWVLRYVVICGYPIERRCDIVIEE
jgi:hypothetical protein